MSQNRNPAMKKNLAFLMVFATLFAGLYGSVNAQNYKFQQYTYEKDGLCHYAVYSIAQDKHGFIWFATGSGLCRYDGFRFSSPNDDVHASWDQQEKTVQFRFSSPNDDFPDANVASTFRDNKGNLWFGYQDGTILKYDGIDFSVVDTSSVSTVVTQIIQAPKGEILAVTQTGIVRIIDKKIDRLVQGFEGITINALYFIDDERLMAGADDGLYLYQYGSDVQQLTFLAKEEKLSSMKVISIIPGINGNGYWVATEYEGIFYMSVDENSFTLLRTNIYGLENAQVQSICEDLNGNLWISTFGEGLFRVHLSPEKTVLKTNIYNNSNGLGSDYVKQVFIDNQQNLWVATYGNGVARIANTAFSFFETLNLSGNNATAVFSGNNSEYWIAGIGTIIRIITEPEEKKTVWGRADGLPNEIITVLRSDDDDNLWIGTEKSGLYKFAKKDKKISLFYREDNSLSNVIQNIIFTEGKIWMATRNGILVIDQKTGKKTEHFDTFESNLPHNNIRDIFEDSKNRIWIATNSNSLIDLRNGSRLTVPDQSETEFSVITEDDQGRIWAATYGKGVFIFDEARDTTYHFTTGNGLKNDYCYAMAFDGNGQIWIGHRLGLTSINTQRLTVKVYGADNGILGDVNPLAMILNKGGEMLVGMTDGVMMYDTKTDQQKDITPMLNLSQVLIGDELYHPLKPIVLPYGKYKIQFDFVGLQYANPNAVSYQYLLLGYDEWGWSSLSTSNVALYPRVEDGDYSFWVRACNSDTCTEETMLYTIKIRKPYWKRGWFVLLVISAVIGLGYVAIAVRERNHRIQQEYLENELKARTKEVRKQKEEIEVKNRDITDSINYAQRIQFSVLPSTGTLMEHCSDAFIFYRPRDIVSGDFYWFDYFPKTHRLLIVCADATGHGVPGAFMSLIGTTLIKDIAIRPDVINPSDILYRLDENIQHTLNQNRESEQANDGMDIIVCEIDTKTHFVKISSAMRPYIIYREGVPTVCKSSRSSIGGQHVEGKEFGINEIQLSKGDTIYMFTDGYTDQFGGPAGKKLKMNRLQTILSDIQNRDMAEQHRVIKENFELWKGHKPQVDDVLMIGVRI